MKMFQCRNFIFGVLFLSSTSLWASLAEPYSATLTMEILKPIGDMKDLNTDAQATRIISETEKTVTIEAKVRPFANQLGDLKPNLNWRQDNSSDTELQKYLRPGLTTNWDEQMRTELLAALKADGIVPEQLDDVLLVQKVSSWILTRFKYINHFVSFYMNFENNKATIDPLLRSAFDAEKSRNGFQSDQEAIDKGIFGKSMFQSRIMGNCTMTATLQATIFKALGIPTRLVGNVLAFDASDPTQVQEFEKQIHHNGLRGSALEKAQESKGKWVNHTFNEVYVGRKWIRLNYNNLGQSPFWNQMGLMVQVFTMADWGESRLTSWAKQSLGIERNFNLSSPNSYRLVRIIDDPATLTPESNPPYSPAQSKYKVIKILRIRNANEVNDFPQALQDVLKNEAQKGLAFFVEVDVGEPKINYDEVKKFRKWVSQSFVLSAPGYPDITMKDAGGFTGYGADGLIFYADASMVPGVKYHIKPVTTKGNYRWEVLGDVQLSRPGIAPVSLSFLKKEVPAVRCERLFRL